MFTLNYQDVDGTPYSVAKTKTRDGEFDVWIVIDHETETVTAVAIPPLREGEHIDMLPWEMVDDKAWEAIKSDIELYADHFGYRVERYL